jgi:hypothetical protein
MADHADRQGWRALLDEQHGEVAAALQSAYQGVQQRLGENVAALEAALGALTEPATAQQMRELRDFQMLLKNINSEMDAFAQMASEGAGRLQAGAVNVATQTAYAQVAAQAGGAQVIAGLWQQPDPAALQNIIQYASSEAFQAAMARFGANAAAQFGDAMLALTAQGLNPRAIAEHMSRWLGIPYAWAENATRTMQMYSYRASSHALYRSNPRVVEGWLWRAALDPRTCMSCVAQHGTRHTLEEELRDHHRGRCAPVPIVIGSTWVDDVQSGETWFTRLPEAQQRAMMGPGMFDAWRRGDFRFADLSRPYYDPIYGGMTRQATLRELLGGRSRSGRGGQIMTVNGWSDADTGLPGGTAAALDDFLNSSNGPLAGALIGAPGERLPLVEIDLDTGAWVVNRSNVSERAKGFVRDSMDIQYPRDYVIRLAQQRAREAGLQVGTGMAEQLMNQQQATTAQAIQSAARIAGVRLTEAQNRRLQQAISGQYLEMVYTTASSKRGSLQNAMPRGARVERTAEGRARQRERREQFMEWVQGVEQ